jgi:hypothetical protein
MPKYEPPRNAMRGIRHFGVALIAAVVLAAPSRAEVIHLHCVGDAFLGGEKIIEIDTTRKLFMGDPGLNVTTDSFTIFIHKTIGSGSGEADMMWSVDRRTGKLVAIVVMSSGDGNTRRITQTAQCEKSNLAPKF